MQLVRRRKLNLTREARPSAAGLKFGLDLRSADYNEPGRGIHPPQSLKSPAMLACIGKLEMSR